MLLSILLFGAMTTGCVLVSALAAYSFNATNREIHGLGEADSAPGV